MLVRFSMYKRIIIRKCTDAICMCCMYMYIPFLNVMLSTMLYSFIKILVHVWMKESKSLKSKTNLLTLNNNCYTKYEYVLLGFSLYKSKQYFSHLETLKSERRKDIYTNYLFIN